jgi:hypothetical protein
VFKAFPTPGTCFTPCMTFPLHISSSAYCNQVKSDKGNIADVRSLVLIR